ncbi:predicted protein [Lichtheimia corymbifera JMRC:FSU:9682]|uniref:Uncharacterized protein n=1 Tax=Lichtheimia corymbifera JMRC:FSU:9682 TaxID=1263082 RepID=A0A068RQM7_9FUNG|nr:predicted protein [Lichtheimia corymbifera JMRC:FSU:9682]
MYDAFQIPPLIFRADPQMQLGLHYTACAHALIAVAIHLALSVGVNVAIEASCNAQIGKQHSDRPFFFLAFLRTATFSPYCSLQKSANDTRDDLWEPAIL